MRIGPSNILVLTFTFPLIVVLFYSSYFSYAMGYDTILILSLILITFHVFECISMKINDKLSLYSCKEECNQYQVIVGKEWVILAFIIVLANFVVRYRYIMAVGAQYGATNLISSLAAARLMIIEYHNSGEADVALPYYAILLSFVAGWVNILCMHIFLYKKIILKQMDIKLGIIILIFLSSQIFSTGRASFFPIAVHTVYLLIIFLNIGDYFVQFVRKHLIKVVTTFLCASLMFLVMGSMREDKEGEGDVELPFTFVVTTYAGAPILGLDVYVRNGMKRAYYFGEHTFREFYDYARIFGVSYKRSQFHKDDFFVGKGSSNVYTGLYYWISDFSLIGAFVYSAFLGLIFGYFFSSRANLTNVAGCYIRSFFYYALILMFYDDQFNNLWGIYMLSTFCVVYFFQKKFFIPA